MISSVDGPSGAGCSETLAIRCTGTWPGESAKAQPLERGMPAQPGHVAVDLVADQDAVLHDVPLLAGDALVVPADGGQPVDGGAVAGHVHQRRAVLQGAELVDGGERRAGVGGLVAQRPVELGGVPDRLVDGEEEVGRVDDEVVAAGLDRRRLRLLPQQLGDLGQLAAPVPAGAGQVLPARGRPAGRGCACSRTGRWPGRR